MKISENSPIYNLFQLPYNVVTMPNYQQRYKFVTSAPVLFVFYALGFGVLEQFPRDRPFSWISVAFIGVPFGLLMAVMTRRRVMKFNRTTGVDDPNKQWEMHDSVRSGRLPSDPEILRAMPDYLDSRIRANEQSRKFSTPFIVFIAVANIAVAIWTRSIVEGLVSVPLIALGIMNHFITSNQAMKLRRLQKQLASTS
jgi:hypothetical protein